MIRFLRGKGHLKETASQKRISFLGSILGHRKHIVGEITKTSMDVGVLKHVTHEIRETDETSDPRYKRDDNFQRCSLTSDSIMASGARCPLKLGIS